MYAKYSTIDSFSADKTEGTVYVDDALVTYKVVTPREIDSLTMCFFDLILSSSNSNIDFGENIDETIEKLLSHNPKIKLNLRQLLINDQTLSDTLINAPME